MWFILLTLLVIWRLLWLWQNRRLLQLSKQLKSDYMCLPFIGHAYKLIGTDEDRMNAFHCYGREALKHGGVTAWWGGNLYVGVADPIIAECILKRFLEKGAIFKKCLGSLIGNGNIIAPVSIWRLRRKLLVVNFSSRRLNEIINVFVRQTDVMVKQLKAKANGGPFPAWKYLYAYTADAIFEAALGVQLNRQIEHDNPVAKSLEVGTKLLSARLSSPWQYFDTIYKLFPAYYQLQKCSQFGKAYLNNIFESKRKSMQQPNDDSSRKVYTQQKTFLEILIEASGGQNGYTNQELCEEITVIAIAATDTTAATTGYVLQMLARHPGIQEKVSKELNEILGDSKRPVQAEDLARLKYLDAVIRETLRLFPPVPVIIRECDEDYTLPSGVTLVKGCQIIVNIWALHRNQKYWGDDAEEFRPERFLDTPFKHPAQFMPFSYGPRNCVAIQYAMRSMKVILSTLLRNFRILPDTPAVPGDAHKPMRFKFVLTMKDVDNCTIRLQDRSLA